MLEAAPPWQLCWGARGKDGERQHLEEAELPFRFELSNVNVNCKY